MINLKEKGLNFKYSNLKILNIINVIIGFSRYNAAPGFPFLCPFILRHRSR